MNPTRKTNFEPSGRFLAIGYKAHNNLVTLIVTSVFYRFFNYCVRFLRWILPEKDNNLTEEAAFPMVPAKALPAFTTKELCVGCSWKSFSTLPWVERAITSIEA